MKFQPAIKWSGSKRSQSEEIIKRINNKDFDTYYEPFCGGCSVLFQLLHSDKSFKKYICSDKNNDLITLWNLIKNNPSKVINEYTKMWHELNIDNDKERKKQYFYMVRDRFNKHKNPTDFMFIMRTTTNGMPRYNLKGEFNNSFHTSRDGIIPTSFSKIINQWSEVLNKFDVQFINTSYYKIQTKENDFMYLDPPYGNTKGMYYGTIDFDKLWSWIRNQDCDYILSFDGKTTALGELNIDMTYPVPKDIYLHHEYLCSGNSSFRRINGSANNIDVYESLYTSYTPSIFSV